jgi:PBP1b-binding outer membrane lipoprotein LpoB
MTRMKSDIAMLCAALLIVGCASGVGRPDAQIARADASIKQAEQDGARQYSGTEFDAARDKVAEARRLADKGKNAPAGALADQAQADADLAGARARRQTAVKAAAEVQAGTDTLRQEVNRQQVTQ